MIEIYSNVLSLKMLDEQLHSIKNKLKNKFIKQKFIQNYRTKFTQRNWKLFL